MRDDADGCSRLRHQPPCCTAPTDHSSGEYNESARRRARNSGTADARSHTVRTHALASTRAARVETAPRTNTARGASPAVCARHLPRRLSSPSLSPSVSTRTTANTRLGAPHPLTHASKMECITQASKHTTHKHALHTWTAMKRLTCPLQAWPRTSTHNTSCSLKTHTPMTLQARQAHRVPFPTLPHRHPSSVTRRVESATLAGVASGGAANSHVHVTATSRGGGAGGAAPSQAREMGLPVSRARAHGCPPHLHWPHMAVRLLSERSPRLSRRLASKLKAAAHEALIHARRARLAPAQ